MANEARILKIHDIKPIEGADRIEVAVLEGEAGFCCVVGKGTYSVGDLTLFIEPDSVIPDNIVEQLKTTSKINVSNRIRAIKIRRVISEGLCLKPEEWLPKDKIEYGFDASELLGVKHYEPKEPKGKGWKSVKGANPWYQSRGFRKYVHIDRIEKVCNCFEEGMNVHISTKLHGMNARYGYCDKEYKYWWQRLLQKLHVLPEKEYLVGSHRTIRNIGKKGRPLPPEVGDQDNFILAGRKYYLRETVECISQAFDNKDVVIYAELIGWGIDKPLQKGYWYGIPEGEVELRIFDILVDGRYLDMEKVFILCSLHNLPAVDTLYEGPFSLDLLKLAEEVDEVNDWKGNREGIVVKAQPAKHDHRMGYVVAKKINPKYLLDKNNTQYH